MQTIAITDPKYKGIISSCNTADIEFCVVRNDFSFQSFLKKDMQLYRHCGQLILLRRVISENDKELAELLNQFLIIYNDVKLIIIYPGAKSNSPDFLKSVLQLDIFNVVTAENDSEQIDELKQSLSENGMDALGWIRLFPELVENGDGAENTGKKKVSARALITASCIAFALIVGSVITVNFVKEKKSVEADTSEFSQADIYTPAEASITTTESRSSSDVSTTTAPRTTAFSKSTTTSAASETIPKPSKTSKLTGYTVSQPKTEASTTKKATKRITATAAPGTTRRTTTKTAVITKSTTTRKTTTASKIHVNGIQLKTGFEANNVVLKPGQNAMVYAVISPYNADDQSVVWRSNKPNVASVNSSGRITAHSKGKAIITAVTKDGGLQASCMVTVE